MDLPNWSISDDRMKLTLTLPTPQGPIVIEQDAKAVEALLEALILARVEMQPPRPLVDPAPGTKMATGAGMRWYAETLHQQKLALLGLLHPGTGWVAIPLEKTQAQDLVRALRRVIAPLPN